MDRGAKDGSGRGRAAVVLLLAIVAAGAGAYFLFFRSRTPPPLRVGSEPAVETPVQPKPLLAGWKDPAAVVVLTGEQHGYLEPCGCSENQSGGLARRASLFRQLREKRWDVVGLDLGGALNRDRLMRAQEGMKFELTRNAQQEMQYEAAALGSEELLWGPDHLLNRFAVEHAEDENFLPFLSANVMLFGTRDVGTPLEYLVLEVGDVKVGVTAVFGRSYRNSIFPDGISDEGLNIAFQPPAEVLPGVIEKLKAEQADVLILLSHCEVEESQSLAKQFPEFQVVATAGAGEAPPEEPTRVGDTLFLRLGERGKYAGVLGVFPDEEPKLRFELVELDKHRFESAEAIVELMREYQQRLQAERPDLNESALRHPTGDEFAGVDACKKCHTKAYAVWSKSKHAHAFETLDKGREGEEATWINRQFDAECLACHVTGWNPQQAKRYESGFMDFARTPHLAGQQCENCHGPAAHHVELELQLQMGGSVSDDHLAARKALHLVKEQARTQLCIQCHDLDNSPQFDTPEKTFDEYWWPKVEHKGKD